MCFTELVMICFICFTDYILSPEVVHFRKRKLVFSDIWTGSFVTFAKEKNTGDIYSWGLSNYYQLGKIQFQNNRAE